MTVQQIWSQTEQIAQVQQCQTAMVQQLSTLAMQTWGFPRNLLPQEAAGQSSHVLAHTPACNLHTSAVLMTLTECLL